ncbi:MAG: T9SS type A sorting domain-containing protein [Saprospiraceae bacterium]|nr:T9SS type A sorting domain-containing protein [Saprospiraceae bacterium]
MRLSSLLPMLLLFVTGWLPAQNQCSIQDLTATVSPLTPNACQYFVKLDFKHVGTTNQFVVTGNGNNYGIFTYNQVPLTLGPFTADPAPSSKEFVVTDAIFQDCRDSTTAQVPGCFSTTTCEIYNVKVEVGDCVPGSLTYKLKLDFQVSNPNADSFEVWAGNGAYLGAFALAQLPLGIPNFPWDGDLTDKLTVCIKDKPNCCAKIQFAAPSCLGLPCNILDLSVQTGDCTSDSTYQVKLNFSPATTTPIPPLTQFGVWANDSLLGYFNLSDLPLSIDSFPWGGGAKDVVKVCIVDLLNTSGPPQIVCCKTLEFAAPDCLPIYPCGIKGLSVETDSCTSDSTFGVWVNFTVNDPSAVDSFQLWGNGLPLGTFGMDQLPLYVADFPWNNGIFSHLKVCTGNAPTCCQEFQFRSPDCVPFGPCEVTDIFVQTGACTSDSTYKVRLNFQATNPGDGTFEVWANGVSLGTFSIDSVPLVFDSFPWSGNDVDVVSICVNDSASLDSCCLAKEFEVPDCLTGDTCSIFNVSVTAGPCNIGNQTYSVTLNFEVNNPGSDFFEVWTANGIYLGMFPLSQLPITIPAFPCNNTLLGKLKICIKDSPGCCTLVEFQAPDCCAGTGPCEISNLTVETGDCTSNSTYEVWLNFSVANPIGNQFGVWANGQFLGNYSLDSLPLYIPDFPWDGGPNDVVKVCFISNTIVGCCKTLEFKVPDCLNPGGPCEISNLTVETGDCTSDSTYQVWLNFQVQNPPGSTFTLWINGVLYDSYSLDSLPLYIADFPWGGGQKDVIKVCFTNAGAIACCRTKEFNVPDCLNPGGPCEISNLTVETGDCTSDSTYQVWLNFHVQNPTSNTFTLWINGVLYDSYSLDSLPLYIADFPWGGGQHDEIKVCLANANIPGTACCRTKGFAVPDCLNPGGPCEITHLTVETGDCTSDSTYQVWLNFQVQNPTSNTFTLWINGVLYDSYSLDSLPLYIENFPWGGGQKDVIKVCLVAPNAASTCCRTEDFKVPDCLNPGGPCEITHLTVETGDCTSDSTYQVWLNFQVQNPTSNTFTLWINGVLYDSYSLDSLPLYIENFPWGGGQHDEIKVCLVNANIPGTACCRTKGFAVPDCLDPGGPCEITHLTVETGDCTSDSTYQVWLNFQVQNPPGNQFGVWANGEFLGLFALDSLPLYIPDFPWDGGQHDVVKVCFPASNIGALCCRTKEFSVPDCLGQEPCDIWDLQVVKTPCLCSEFFAVITFKHKNGGSEGFDIVGNGSNYGNYPYNHPQPIIIGPFPGDDATNYKFGVVDHLNPDCADDVQVGTVDCIVAVVNPGSNARLTLSPNPVSSWLNVLVQVQNGIPIGEATVELYHADGRRVRTLTVTSGNNFLLDVSDLPAGVYRLSLLSAIGRVEGSFAKQ